MKRLLSAVALLALSGSVLTLSAQQTPTSQAPDTAAPATTQQTVDAQSPQSAQSFEGTITKSGSKLVLQDTATQASYKLDDQDKAKQFEGKKVKVMATMDSATNTLHVVDISPSESR
jgi:hypothetical protein